MTLEQLRVLIEEFSKRSDLRKNGLLDLLIEIAAIRIGHDVKLMELERIATLNVVDKIGLPDDYRAMRNVSIETPNGIRTLQSVTSVQFARPADGIEVYNIKNGQIHIRGTADITLNYTIRPERLVADNDTNYVLDNYQTLYLYGTLMEVWSSALDAEAFGFAQQRYLMEVDSVNIQYDRQTFGSNAAIKRVDK